jgi:nucleoside triphosphatase
VSEKPEVVVVGVVVLRGQILVTKSDKWGGKYSLPGGHLEKGETFYQALKREMMEETGMDIVAADLVSIGEFISPSEYSDPDRHFVVLLFRCRPASYGQIRVNEEASSFMWVPVGEAGKPMLTGLSALALDKISGPVIDHFEDAQAPA